MPFRHLPTQLDMAMMLSEASDSYRGHAETLLLQSAATDGQQVRQYRPYIVAALLLEQQPKQQKLSEADGATFTGMAVPIESFYRLQSRIDMAHPDWIIPMGFIAPVIPIDGSTADPDQAGIFPYFLTQAIQVERRT